MTKRKTNNIGVFILLLLFLVIGCSKDDTPEQELLSEQEEDIFTTTSTEDVLNLFQNSNLSRTVTSIENPESSNNSFFTPDLENISQEPLVNSEAKMTVIPATISRHRNNYSRVLALDIAGEMRTAVFTMYPNQESQDNGFNGHFVSYTLEGEIINAFRVEKDTIVAKVLLPRDRNNITTASNERININIATSTGAECNCTDDPFLDCCFIDLGSLDEVVIIASTGGIPVEQTFEPSNTASVDIDNINNEPVTFLTGGGGTQHNDDDNDNPPDCGPNYYWDTNTKRCERTITLCGPGQIPDGKGGCVESNPCNQLKLVNTSIEVSNSYTDLQNRAGQTTQTREFGYSLVLGEAPVEASLGRSGLNLNHSFGGLVYGMSHTHPTKDFRGDIVYPMFSVEDIYNLAKIATTHSNPLSPNKDYSLFVFTLTVSNGVGNGTDTFALKISDWLQFISFGNRYFTMSKRDRRRFNSQLQDDYKDVSNNGGGTNGYLRAMFDFMSENGINGVEVFQATDNNLTNWEQKTSDATQPDGVKDTPCN